MNDLYLKDIYIYPIKSLGGISLPQAAVHSTGLQYDRRWMLVDENGKFLSQRTFAQMALLQVTLEEDGLLVAHKAGKMQPLKIPFDATTGKVISVQVWDDECEAVEVSKVANSWFSEALGLSVRLVYMPSSTRRLVDPNYATARDIVSFADAFPLLVIGQSSLDDLNTRLKDPVKMNRFRPNLVFSGGAPYCEDQFKRFKVGEVIFNAVKPCARCVLTTVNQEDGTKGQEPLKTLATYRTKNNKVMFGQNLLHENLGVIKTGDKLEL